MKCYWLVGLGLISFLLLNAGANAANVNIEWGGKFFTNWLYGNDDTQFACYAAPFGGHGKNGINSELELSLKANVSDYVEVGARIKNRFRKNYWATFWDNNGETTATGETNEANQYMKLRGVYARFKPPSWASPFIQAVHLGASDLGMFNAWTVGRIRYIDRDNAMGTFLNGAIGEGFSYDVARISLPSRWAGPGWTSRGNGYHNTDGFMNRDFVYAGAFRFDVSDTFDFAIIGDHTTDVEGSIEDDNPRDGHELVDRFNNTVVSVEMSILPSTVVDLNILGAYSTTNYEDTFDYVERWGGYNAMPQDDVKDFAAKALLTLNDPFGVGLNVKVEYFNIGEDYVSLMAARRESDVLITEGFEGDDTPGAPDWGGWLGTRGQTPTINVDNNETQFDEQAYQNIIGWHGATLLLEYASSALELAGEVSHIMYNTDAQGRDMSVYPLNGGFGAPDNAYNEYQERTTNIALIRGKYAFFASKPFEVSGKIKLINDIDDVNTSISSDDYEYNKLVVDLGLGVDLTSELYFKFGYTLFDKTTSIGSDDYDSTKNRLYVQARYDFGGIKIGYLLENYSGEEQPVGSTESFDDYDLWRSRAFAEVAF